MTKENWWFRFKKKVCIFIGDVKWHGILHPFWFTINAHGYRLKGEHYRRLKELLKPGDILIRRFEGYVDKWLIPGWWNHAGIYVGDDMVIHAIGEGVLKEDILNFMRCDHMCVLRAEERLVPYALEAAEKIVGAPYDFDFDFANANRFSCTELAAYCYPGMFAPKRRWSALGKKVLVADDFLEIPGLKMVWDSRYPEVYGFAAPG